MVKPLPMDLTRDELEVGRLAVENMLVELRDSRISVMRNNGLCIKEKDSTPSAIVRMPIETAITVAMEAIEKHRAQKDDTRLL